MNFFTSESTSRAHSNIDDILRANMEATHGERIAREGSIGPAPLEVMASYPGQELGILNPLEWMGGLGVAGRVSKAAITGGQRASGNTGELVNWVMKKLGRSTTRRGTVKPKNVEDMKLRRYFADLEKGMKTPKISPKAPGKRYKDISELEWDNKINAARIKAQKIYDKYRLPHESEMVDPITSILDIVKRN